MKGGRPDEVPLTKEEENAINTLKRLAKRWPKSLWLWSASGTLNIMRTNEDGERAMTSQDYTGAVDSDYCVDRIDISNDGGDW